MSFGDMTHAESSHRPVSVSCASNCCAKHRVPLCIVDSDFHNLIDQWLCQLDILYAHIRRKTYKKWGVIGFRSSKYDLLVIKGEKGGRTEFLIKRSQSYPCISAKGYRFLDICEYVVPISYVQFLQSMKVENDRK